LFVWVELFEFALVNHPDVLGISDQQQVVVAFHIELIDY
jgi:hypothetical protein